jgi:hypothetical protein
MHYKICVRKIWANMWIPDPGEVFFSRKVLLKLFLVVSGLNDFINSKNYRQD